MGELPKVDPEELGERRSVLKGNAETEAFLEMAGKKLHSKHIREADEEED